MNLLEAMTRAERAGLKLEFTGDLTTREEIQARISEIEMHLAMSAPPAMSAPTRTKTKAAKKPSRKVKAMATKKAKKTKALDLDAIAMQQRTLASDDDDQNDDEDDDEDDTEVDERSGAEQAVDDAWAAFDNAASKSKQSAFESRVAWETLGIANGTAADIHAANAASKKPSAFATNPLVPTMNERLRGLR